MVKFNSTPTKDWTCENWMQWHSALLVAFKEGRFKSGIKYSDAAALMNANKVFTEWWNRLVGTFSSKTLCGYRSEFYTYFKKAGLSDSVLSYFQSIVTPTLKATGKITENVTETVTNVSEGANNLSKYFTLLIWIAAIGLGYYAFIQIKKS
jgi:hypothetical protein